jgi:hypothetical protein
MENKTQIESYPHTPVPPAAPEGHYAFWNQSNLVWEFKKIQTYKDIIVEGL